MDHHQISIRSPSDPRTPGSKAQWIFCNNHDNWRLQSLTGQEELKMCAPPGWPPGRDRGHREGTYPPVICYIAIEHGQFVVDLHLKGCDDFHSYVNVYHSVCQAKNL